MKCESCGNELTGGAIICRVCNHNNALRGDWRSRRNGQQTAPRRSAYESNQSWTNQSLASQSSVELPKIVPRKDADDNLLRFTPASHKQVEVARPAPARQTTGVGIETGTAAYPPWRVELKERVRQIREKRTTGDLVTEPPSPVRDVEVDLDRNPIVESALNRIRWASHTPAITTTLNPRARIDRRNDEESEGHRDIDTERQREVEKNLPVTPSLRHSVSPSHRPSVTPSPRPAITRPTLHPVEAKTAPPKTHRDAAARLESKPAPAPAPKILTPRAPRQTTAELREELRSERRVPEPVAPTEATFRAARGPRVDGPLSEVSDKHVETQVIEIAQAPETLPPPQTEPASLWSRTMAGACDFEIVMIAYLPIFGSFALLNNSFRTVSSAVNESTFIMVALLSAIAFIYQMITLLFAGRTFGMAMLNLTLLNTDDESLPVTLWQKLLRAMASTIVFICVPLYLVTWLNPSRRSLPDLISGTTVARQ
jgi:uncharacterized RDD family membrane protein YckC